MVRLVIVAVAHVYVPAAQIHVSLVVLLLRNFASVAHGLPLEPSPVVSLPDGLM